MVKDILHGQLTAADLYELLSLQQKDDIHHLFSQAYLVKKEEIGQVVFLRGLVELSNICGKDCYYCGIRKSNHKVKRYTLTPKEVISSCKLAYEQGYGSVVLQAGENSSQAFIDYATELIREIKNLSNNKLGITLSFGEQNQEVYRQWKEAGAHRYLLRVETSNPNLYETLHPGDHSFSKRLNCLRYLRELNYQVGTGVMIGLPGQSVKDLVKDILFFREMDIDMVGMGPYIPQADTPLANADFDEQKIENSFMLTLKMIACARIYLRDINIAATTALQAINSHGRERGLLAGANIIMPNITASNYRKDYQLYNNKPDMNEKSSQYMEQLIERISSIGETIAFNQWGDSPYYLRRLSESRKQST